MNLGIILTAILLPLILAEVGEVSPWLARRVLRCGARCIGDSAATDRYTEEWLAGIEDTPGKLTKLLKALGIVLSAVPALHWHSRKLVYGWPVSRAVDALVAFIAPSLSRRMRARRAGGFTVFIAGENEFHSTVEELRQVLQLIVNASGVIRILPASQIVCHGSLNVMIDYKRRRIIFCRIDGSPDYSGDPPDLED